MTVCKLYKKYQFFFKNKNKTICQIKECNSCSIIVRRGCGVHKDKVLRQLLDVFLQLSQFLFASFLFIFLSNCVNFLNMRYLLVLLVNYFPFFLKSLNQFLSLVVWEQELLFFSFIFFLDLHFLDQLILVFNFLLDLLQVLGSLSVCLFL